MSVQAQVSFGSEDASPMGRDRIRLLEAVAQAGSISGAARSIGITYKAAWDAIDAVNNLFGRPLVSAQAGGKRGGGAVVTPEGVRVIQTFHRLEAELARTFQTVAPELSGTGLSATHLMWSLLMRTSARNALRCIVIAVVEGLVNAEILLELAEGTVLTAVITRDSVRDLELRVGREAVALIKSSFVMLAPVNEVGRTSARNRIHGIVSRREDGGVNTEIVLDIGGGKTLTAVITTTSANELGLEVGAHALALIDAAHVILAVD